MLNKNKIQKVNWARNFSLIQLIKTQKKFQPQPPDFHYAWLSFLNQLRRKTLGTRINNSKNHNVFFPLLTAGFSLQWQWQDRKCFLCHDSLHKKHVQFVVHNTIRGEWIVLRGVDPLKLNYMAIWFLALLLYVYLIIILLKH